MTQEGSGASTAYDTRVVFRRVVATIIDYFVFGLAFYILSLPFESVRSFDDIKAIDPAAPTETFLFLFCVSSLLAYYILLEGLYGQTLGKMFVGVQVVLEDTGDHPGLRAAALRTILRIIDSTGSYLLAFVVALLSARDRRIGDMVAKTLVIRK